MRGRITSAERVNEHGVCLRVQLERERKAHAELVAGLRDALRAWQRAYRASLGSRDRRRLVRLAREKTVRALL